MRSPGFQYDSLPDGFEFLDSQTSGKKRWCAVSAALNSLDERTTHLPTPSDLIGSDDAELKKRNFGVETGKCNPSILVVERIAKALGGDVSEIFKPN